MAVTVAGWIAYAAERGDTVADNADAASALVRAADHIEFNYLNRASRSVPDDVVEKATYEAAKSELETPGFWTKTFTPDQQRVLTGAGDIKWTVRGEASGGLAATPVSTKIEGMFRPYVQWYLGAFTA